MNAAYLAIKTLLLFFLSDVRIAEGRSLPYINVGSVSKPTGVTSNLQMDLKGSAILTLEWSKPHTYVDDPLHNYMVHFTHKGLWDEGAPSIKGEVSVLKTQYSTILDGDAMYCFNVTAHLLSQSILIVGTDCLTSPERSPSSPRNLQLVSVYENSIDITWECPLNPNGHLLAYVVYYNEDALTVLLSNSTNGTSLRLNGLKSKTVYMINISAVNTAGEGRQSASIAVETMPSLLESPLTLLGAALLGGFLVGMVTAAQCITCFRPLFIKSFHRCKSAMHMCKKQQAPQLDTKKTPNCENGVSD